jgi:predicted ATPase
MLGATAQDPNHKMANEGAAPTCQNPTMPTDPTFITNVKVQNYKSIKACDVSLGRLTVLVGPNGSGKSNFLDALRFVSDALTTTLDHALRDRGGINEVRRRSGGHPNNFAIRLDVRLRSGAVGHFSFKVGAVKPSGFRVTDEECVVLAHEIGGTDAHYRVRNGTVQTNLQERLPAQSEDRLFLVSASNVAAFRPLFDALTSMGFYNLSPAAIREPQQPDPGALLRRDGSNLASVLAQLERAHQPTLVRIVEYLERVAPGVTGVSRKPIGTLETIEFRQRPAGQDRSWSFPASNMSDGTLRGLGVLVALLQSNGSPPSLVGIEEPEVALHPAAVGILIDAVRDAAQHTQVLVTSHSPDLLERDDVGSEQLLSVTAEGGVTTIGRVDEPAREALRKHLFTAGELLRLNQLTPSPEARAAANSQQLDLFDT